MRRLASITSSLSLTHTHTHRERETEAGVSFRRPLDLSRLLSPSHYWDGSSDHQPWSSSLSQTWVRTTCSVLVLCWNV